MRLGRFQASVPLFSRLQHAPVALLGGLYLYAVGLTATRTPLWFDEIVTYHVSALGSPHAVIEALLAKADNHPPLDYLARNLSMSLFGGSELAFRLPSIVAMLVGGLCLYVFVLRRTSVLAALVSFSFPFATLAIRYSYEGRGYAFLMASMCLVLLAWQLASEKPTAPRLIFLAVSLSIGPYSHYYGVLNYLPVVVGEAWRSWEGRKIYWPIAGSIVASLALLGPLAPFVLHASEFSGTFWTKLGPNMVVHAYIKLFELAIPVVMAGLVGAAAFLFLAPFPDSRRPAPAAMPRHEVAAAALLCMMPFITYVLALAITHAFTFKYTLNTVVGAAVLTGYLVHQASGWRRGLAFLLTLSFGAWAAASLAYLPGHVEQRIFVNARNDARILSESTLPMVASAHRYLEDNFYLPVELRSRIFYIGDSNLALELRGHDTNERALHNLKPFAPIHGMDLCSFTKRYPEFLLRADELRWIADKLIADRADVVLHPAGSRGSVVFSVILKGPIGC